MKVGPIRQTVDRHSIATLVTPIVISIASDNESDSKPLVSLHVDQTDPCMQGVVDMLSPVSDRNDPFSSTVLHTHTSDLASPSSDLNYSDSRCRNASYGASSHDIHTVPMSHPFSRGVLLRQQVHLDNIGSSRRDASHGGSSRPYRIGMGPSSDVDPLSTIINLGHLASLSLVGADCPVPLMRLPRVS